MKKLSAFALTCAWALVCPAHPLHAATLIYSNDVLGDIEPCSCRSNPQGGFVRKEQLLKSLGDRELLQLDAGDLLFSTDTIPDLLKKQAELQASYLLKAMGTLGHNAVTPGEKDFALGLSGLKKLIKNSQIRFLAANLADSKGKPVFPPYAIFTLGSLRVAVIGIVGSSIRWPEGLKAGDPVASAKKIVAEVKPKSDLVIVLSHQGIEDDELLSRKVSGIDIIVGGHSQAFLQTPKKSGQTVIYQSSFRNQYVGVVPLKKPFDGNGHQLIGLDASYEPKANEQEAKVGKITSEFKLAMAEMEAKADITCTKDPKKEVRSGYQTLPKCAECHLKQLDFWRGTAHAKALGTLIKKNKASDPACLKCHSLGYGEKLGFTDVGKIAEKNTNAKTPAYLNAEDLQGYLNALQSAKKLKEAAAGVQKVWAPVQCENCHEPGGDHPFDGNYSKKVSDNTCLNCHTAEYSSSWYRGSKPDKDKIAEKRAKVSCPAGNDQPED